MKLTKYLCNMFYINNGSIEQYAIPMPDNKELKFVKKCFPNIKIGEKIGTYESAMTDIAEYEFRLLFAYGNWKYDETYDIYHPLDDFDIKKYKEYIGQGGKRDEQGRSIQVRD